MTIKILRLCIAAVTMIMQSNLCAADKRQPVSRSCSLPEGLLHQDHVQHADSVRVVADGVPRRKRKRACSSRSLSCVPHKQMPKTLLEAITNPLSDGSDSGGEYTERDRKCWILRIIRHGRFGRDMGVISQRDVDGKLPIDIARECDITDPDLLDWLNPEFDSK